MLFSSSPIEVAAKSSKPTFKYQYGVFISVNANRIVKRAKDYETIVVDAQYYTKSDLQKLHQKGHVVYSYINLGSLEDWRDYYKKYKDITIGRYDGWEDESWVDVSQKKWQDKLKAVSKSLVNKGVDGLFVDNIDVYEYVTDQMSAKQRKAYKVSAKKIYSGITTILKDFRGLKKKGSKKKIQVILNGGTSYVAAFRGKNKGSAKAVMTGINQESVFSEYNNSDGIQDKDSSKEYQRQLQKNKKDGMKVYLLEYTSDKKLIKRIRDYCKKHGYEAYITSSVNLE